MSSEESLTVRRNRIVHLSLQVVDAQSGELIEHTTPDSPHVVYLHGHGNLVQALEDALQGLAHGDTFEVVVANAFGEWLPEACQTHERRHVTLPDDCTVGQRIATNGPNGRIELTVSSLDTTHVTLDANHPLAGRTLQYTGQVLRILRAHKDEIRHHRPHPAGHHLMVQDSSFDGKIRPEDCDT